MTKLELPHSLKVS